jgi:ankyrin repeat protein
MLLAAGGGAVLNTFDYICRTPLMWAVDAGHIEIVRALIDAGSDVNARDEARIGNTALHFAVEKERAEMVELLLRAGADPSAPGWMRLTPLDKAERRKSPEGQRVLAMLRSPASVRTKPLSNRKRRRQRSSPE